MNVKMRTASLFALTLTLFASLGAAAQDAPKLRHKATAGQAARYKSEGTLAIEAGGMKLNVELKQTSKQTVTAVDSATGNITIEEEDESSETSINGQKVPESDKKSKTTTVYRPDGTLVSLKGDEPEQAKLSARLFSATHPVYDLDKPLTAGAKWTKELKGDDSLGTKNAKVEGEVVGMEKVNGADAVRLKLIYQETEGSPKLTVKSNALVELSSGDTLKSELEIDGFPAPGGITGNGKIRTERVEGSLLKVEGQAAIASKPKDKDIDETVKEFEKIPGQFTLYRKKEAAGRETLYLEIKEEQLDKNLMLQATAGSGTSDRVVTGDPINDLLLRFTKIGDDRLFLIVPNYNFRAEENTPVATSVRRSFADSILEAYKIEAKQASRKSVLINVSDLFRGDIAMVSQLFMGGGGSPLAALGGGGGNYSLDKEKTYIASIKNFPANLVVETSYNFAKGGGGGSMFGLGGQSALPDPRSATIRVVYNLFQLPENDYRPRLNDPRVGYFLTEYQDFTRDGLNDPKIRYILRWDLQKADPTARLSAPKQPIVFWLDNAIPMEYRDAVKEGLLRWNKAFEKIGFKEAVVVKQMPDNADWSHADMRYNVIRWVSSPGSAYAVALFRANPITGQIVNASITVDGGIVNYTKLERKLLVEPAAWFSKDDPEVIKQRMLAKRKRHGMTGFGCADCDMMEQATEQAWFGMTALKMMVPGISKAVEADFTRAFVADVVAHEMGHILGLRHNFIASTNNTLEQLGDPERVKQVGVAASVMDYTPFNIAAIRKKNVDYFNTSVGPYDMWAIEYGYTHLDGKKPQDERYKLAQIASKTNQPGLAYQSDEVADSFDPLVTRFDLTKDPIGYWTKHMQVARFLMLNLDKRQPLQGESYWEFTRDFYRLIGEYTQGAAVASRYIGGLHVNRNFKGDAGEKPTLVPASADDQKRALDLLNTYVFAENAFKFPPKYYTQLTSNPNADFMTAFSTRQDYPIMDTFASIQKSAIQRLFRTDVMNRIVNNEFKVGNGDKSLSLATLFRSVGANVWSELESKKNTDALRRSLQRTHLEAMVGMVVNPSAAAPEDAKMMAWDQLRRLQGKLQTALRGGSYDAYTQVHLEESLMRVTRALEARQTIGGSGGAPRALSILDLLGGQQK